jgi:hypothetical protein
VRKQRVCGCRRGADRPAALDTGQPRSARLALTSVHIVGAKVCLV